MIDPDELLEIAVAAAVEAGGMLTAKRADRPEVVATKSSPDDLVTELDRESERLIRARVSAARPHDAFLGEEGGDTAGSSDVRWVVDPIDGTVNFVYGLPEWAVSIAAEVAGEVVAAVVNIPPRGELFTATRGVGAYASFSPAAHEPTGEQPLRCNSGVRLARALVATGFGYDPAVRLAQAQMLVKVLPEARDIRRGGSCAVDLCSLAAGRVDAYYERGVNYWDFAAAGLIAEEAGARLGGLHGRRAGPDMTIAAAPELFGELHDLLA